MPVPSPILFLLNSSFPEYSGGRENWLSHVANRLAVRGREVHILTIGPTTKQPTHYELHGDVRLHRVYPICGMIIGRLMTMGPLRFIRTFVVVPQFRSALRSLLNRLGRKPIVIGLDTIITPLAVRTLRQNLMFVCASKGPHAEVMSTEFPWLRRYLARMELRAYAECTEVWSNGFDMQEYIRQQGFESIVVGNGVDVAAACAPRPIPPEFCRRDHAGIIVSAGSLLDIKGVPEAIEATAHILAAEAETPLDLFFIGKGDPRKYLQRCRHLGIESRVHFLGVRNDVFSYMQHDDMLLCLSGGGGLSMAALESLASRTPVIAWDTPVYRQMVTHGETGFLVPHRDAEGLAAAIRGVRRMTPRERSAIGEKARRSVDRFDWEKIVDRIEQRLGHLDGRAISPFWNRMHRDNAVPRN